MLTRAIPGGLALLVGVTACLLTEPEQTVVRVYEIDHHGIECGGESLDLCLLAREAGDVTFVPLFPIPTGFEYRWGYRYTVEVAETPIANPPADGPGIRRHLQAVRREEQVAAGTRFEVILTGGEGRVVQIGEHRFSIYGVAEFECASSLRCAELAALLVAGRRIMFSMRHVEPGQAIVLEAWSEV
jgi:hypothetical protein